MKTTTLHESKTVNRSGMLPSAIVLCHLADNPQRFVTWVKAWREDGLASTFWGHYFDDLGDALADYYERVNNLK